MPKAKLPPLTGAEISLAKRVNSWVGNRKELSLPSDRAGNPFTTKNLGDVCDQYLQHHDERIALDGLPVDRDSLVLILRRYRARKGVQRKAVKKRLQARAENKAKKLAQAAEKKAFAEAKSTKKREEAERQGTFDFPRSDCDASGALVPLPHL